tara:strand:+ start:42 stop:548 length:507 start_codon:yes stop_codon:yes gene_type:complete
MNIEFSQTENIVLDFAEAAHRSQKRKYTGEDYIEHPIAVAKRVKNDYGNQNMVCAALLHDVLEDTAVEHDQLRTFLYKTMNIPVNAEVVLQLVVELTDVYTKEAFPYLNRKERKCREAFRLRDVSRNAQRIKRADIRDNSVSINEHDPKFAEVFNREKDFIMSVFGVL